MWTPVSKPQLEAYFSKANELYYGGAAGGGKTDLEIGLAANKHTRSIIFRREFPQLKLIIERGKQILKSVAKYNHSEHTWHFYNEPDKLIELGAVQYEADTDRYHGRPHDLVCFDEITQFTPFQYDILRGWNRTENPNQQCRIVATGNPPLRKSANWVIDYWAPWLKAKHDQKAGVGELRWYYQNENGETVWMQKPEPVTVKGEKITPSSRSFIFANVRDNPYYVNTEYEKVLQSLPEPYRSALLHGRFDLTIDDDPWQVIPTTWIELAMKRWKDKKNGDLTSIGIDVARGGMDKTVIARRSGNYFYKLIKFPGSATPNGQSVAAQVVKFADKMTRINLDVIGIGASVQDYLNEYDMNVIPLNSSARSTAKDRSGKFGFVNLRAEMWWKFREALDPDHGDDVALPPDDKLLEDLAAPRYSLALSGIKIEKKEETKKRIGRSPDDGDAVVYCAYTGKTVGYLV